MNDTNHKLRIKKIIYFNLKHDLLILYGDEKESSSLFFSSKVFPVSTEKKITFAEGPAGDVETKKY